MLAYHKAFIGVGNMVHLGDWSFCSERGSNYRVRYLPHIILGDLSRTLSTEYKLPRKGINRRTLVSGHQL